MTFRCRPPPYPVSDPLLPIARWQGTMMLIRLAPWESPTARKAKRLIHETQMSMTDVALAAGFNSLRRFNEVFQSLFKRPPSAIRRKPATGRASAEDGITLNVRYRPPYDWESMLDFLRAGAIPGVEVVEKNCYYQTVETIRFYRLQW